MLKQTSRVKPTRNWELLKQPNSSAKPRQRVLLKINKTLTCEPAKPNLGHCSEPRKRLFNQTDLRSNRLTAKLLRAAFGLLIKFVNKLTHITNLQ